MGCSCSRPRSALDAGDDDDEMGGGSLHMSLMQGEDGKSFADGQSSFGLGLSSGIMAPVDGGDTGSARLIRSKGRIEVMGFEVANVIVRAINLRQSLLQRDIEDLRQEVLASEGIRMLVSDDFESVWAIAADDKKSELRAVARDVARLGKQCLSLNYHSLDQEFDTLGTAEAPKCRMTASEVDAELKSLEAQAQVTADLYHELSSLESMQQALSRRLKEEDGSNTLGKEVLNQMKAEVKAQEKMVKLMKKKGLWGQTMDLMVEKLLQIVIFLFEQIVDVFGKQAVGSGGLMSQPFAAERDMQRLGVCGMSLQYANIVNMIDTMVMRPASVEQNREALYGALPNSIRRRLRRALMQSASLERESPESLRQHMEGILDWLVTMAENTIRFGVDNRLQGHTDLTLLQTLHHVQDEKMESLVLDLIVALQHLASREEGARHIFPKGAVPKAALRSHVSSAGADGNGAISDDAKKAAPEEEDDDDDLGETWKIKSRPAVEVVSRPVEAVKPPVAGPVQAPAAAAAAGATAASAAAATAAGSEWSDEKLTEETEEAAESFSRSASLAEEVEALNAAGAGGTALARPSSADRRRRRDSLEVSKGLPPLPESGAGNDEDFWGPPVVAKRTVSFATVEDDVPSSMTKSQSFAPAGFAGDGLMRAMQEAALGKARSQTFNMGAIGGAEGEKKYVSKSLSRKELATLMEADDEVPLYASQRIRPMTPVSIDVDGIDEYPTASGKPPPTFPRSLTQ